MQTRVWASLVAASLGWGLAGVAVRFAFERGASTFTVVDVRLVVATLALMLYAGLARKRPTAEAWKKGAVIGVLRIAGAPVMFIAALQHISAGVEALFITLIPVVTGVFAWRFLREPLVRRQIVGMSLGLVGAVVLIAGGESGLGAGRGNALVGGLLALIGVLLAASSGVLQRAYAPSFDTANLAVPMFVVGTVIALLVSTFFGGVHFDQLDGTLWLVLVALGLLSTLLPFVATLFASRYISAAKVSVVGYVAPVVSVTAGIALLDEVLSPEIVAGGVLAIVGAALVTTGRGVQAPPPVRVRG